MNASASKVHQTKSGVAESTTFLRNCRRLDPPPPAPLQVHPPFQLLLLRGLQLRSFRDLESMVSSAERLDRRQMPYLAFQYVGDTYEQVQTLTAVSQ